MSEELYTTVLPDGRTFRCVKSQLAKTGGKCPVHGHDVYPEFKTQYEAQKTAKVAKLQAELAKLQGD